MLGKNFLDMTPKAWSMKINDKLDIKIKNYVLQNTLKNKWKSKPQTLRENVSTNICDQGLISGIKNSQSSMLRKKMTLFKKGAKYLKMSSSPKKINE